MTAKEYLSQVRFIDRLIDSKLEQLERLKEIATKTTMTLSDMPRSDSPDLQLTETIVMKIVDMERDINEHIDRLVDLKRSAADAISELPGREQQLVLEQRYLCFKSWEQIATELSFSLRHVTRLHGEALQNFRVPLKDVHKCP